MIQNVKDKKKHNNKDNMKMKYLIIVRNYILKQKIKLQTKNYRKLVKDYIIIHK